MHGVGHALAHALWLPARRRRLCWTRANPSRGRHLRPQGRSSIESLPSQDPNAARAQKQFLPIGSCHSLRKNAFVRQLSSRRAVGGRGRRSKRRHGVASLVQDFLSPKSSPDWRQDSVCLRVGKHQGLPSLGRVGEGMHRVKCRRIHRYHSLGRRGRSSNWRNCRICSSDLALAPCRAKDTAVIRKQVSAQKVDQGTSVERGPRVRPPATQQDAAVDHASCAGDAEWDASRSSQLER